MQSFFYLEVLYERSETNEREKDRSFDKYWEQIELARAQTDSDDESEISISSHQTKTDNVTIQKSKGGNVFFEVSTNINTHIA